MPRLEAASISMTSSAVAGGDRAAVSHTPQGVAVGSVTACCASGPTQLSALARMRGRAGLAGAARPGEDVGVGHRAAAHGVAAACARRGPGRRSRRRSAGGTCGRGSAPWTASVPCRSRPGEVYRAAGEGRRGPGHSRGQERPRTRRRSASSERPCRAQAPVRRPTAHGMACLPLLPPGPDGVRRVPLRGTRPSTPHVGRLPRGTAPRAGIQPRCSGLRVQGTAGSPPSAAMGSLPAAPGEANVARGAVRRRRPRDRRAAWSPARRRRVGRGGALGHRPGRVDRGGHGGGVGDVQGVTAVADHDQARVAQPAVEGGGTRRPGRCDRRRRRARRRARRARRRSRPDARRSAVARSRSSVAWRNGPGRSATASAAPAYAAGRRPGRAGQRRAARSRRGRPAARAAWPAARRPQHGDAQHAGEARDRQAVGQHVAADGDHGGHVVGVELGVGDGHGGAQRVAHEHRPLEAEPADRLVQQARLADRRVAVAPAGAPL